MVPWNWAPNNYQLCQGQTLSIQQYMALYSLMATTFGGNASTQFNLPNLQGRAPIGTGNFNGTFFTLGAQTGSIGTTLSVANLPPHNHAATFTPVTGNQIVTIPAGSGGMTITAGMAASTTTGTAAAPAAGDNYLAGVTASTKIGTPLYPATIQGPYVTGSKPSGANFPVDVTVSGSPATAASTVTISSVTGGTVATGTTGTGTPFSTMQPSLAMSFVIATNGLYPDRP
ncbi:phage tail protein [Azospirillum endophyticum]